MQLFSLHVLDVSLCASASTTCGRLTFSGLNASFFHATTYLFRCFLFLRVFSYLSSSSFFSSTLVYLLFWDMRPYLRERERSARQRGTPRPPSHRVRGWPRRTSRALSPPRPAASGCPDHGLWGSVRRRSARRSRERARGVGFSGQLCLNGGSPEGATGQFLPPAMGFYRQWPA